jgi:hypothetical protein
MSPRKSKDVIRRMCSGRKTLGVTERVNGMEIADRWKQKLMRSFRISEQLDALIKQACRRNNEDFSSFVRAAVVRSMRNRAYHGGEAAS